MRYKPVGSKVSFVKRFAAGEFGNRGPMWQTLPQFLASGYRGLVHLRNRTPGGPTWYDIPSHRVAAKYRQVRASPKSYYLAAMAPTSKTVLQGEVQRTTTGLYLYYTTVAKPMREALAHRATTEKGIIANCTLKRFLCPNSFSWLMTLLERYPEHVVEFSTFSVNWGTVPFHNTVFWEVRNY